MADNLLQVLVGDDEEKKLDRMGAKIGLRTRSATIRFLINRDYEAMFPDGSISAEMKEPCEPVVVQE
jgi:hypothetical protein